MVTLVRRYRRVRQPAAAIRPSALAQELGCGLLLLPQYPGANFAGPTSYLSTSGTASDMTFESSHGRAYSSGTDVYATAGELNPQEGYWFLFRGYISAIGTWSGIMGRSRNNGTTSSWAWYRSSTNNTLSVQNGTTVINPRALNDLLDSVPRTWVGLWRPGTTNNLELWRDGKQEMLASHTGTPDYTAGEGYIRLLAQNDTWATNGAWSFMAHGAGVALQSEQAAELSVKPWLLVAPRRIFVPVAAGGGGSWSVSLTETASASDSLDAATTALVSLIESASAADIITAATIAAVALTEAASASDTQTASYSATGSGSVTESASASDTLDAANTMLRALTETASADDQLAAATTMLRAISESASASDAATSSYTAAGAAAITETASATDALTAAATLLVTILEAGSATDALAAATTMVRAITEQATAADEVAASQPIIASVSITELATAIDVLIGELAGGAWVAGDGLMSKPRIGMARNGDLYSLVLDDDGIPVACKRMGTSRLLKLRALPGGNQAQVMVETGVVLVVL